VFKTFYEVAKELEELEGVGHQDNIQLDWLLFQILPLASINSVDPFSALVFGALHNVGLEVLDHLRTIYSPSSVLGSSFNPNTDAFFYVLDEARVAGEQYMGAFADRDGKEKRPVLCPIIEHMSESTRAGIIKVIICSTSVPSDCSGIDTYGVGRRQR